MGNRFLFGKITRFLIFQIIFQTGFWFSDSFLISQVQTGFFDFQFEFLELEVVSKFSVVIFRTRTDILIFVFNFSK